MRQRDRGDGKPRCYGIEMPERVTANGGYEQDLVTGLLSLRLVEIPFAMTRECRAWASDPSTDPVPLAEGWACWGCPRFPTALVSEAIRNREQRRPD